MRVFNLNNRNLIVRAISLDGVLYDAIFPVSKETKFDKLEKSTYNVADDVQRTPNRNRFTSLSNFVNTVVPFGYYPTSDDKAVQSEIDTLVKAHFA